jgi:hypothetical protein
MNISIHGWPLATDIKNILHNDVKGKMSSTNSIMQLMLAIVPIVKHNKTYCVVQICKVFCFVTQRV